MFEAEEHLIQAPFVKLKKESKYNMLCSEYRGKKDGQWLYKFTALKA